jgi:hypothetical protein
LKTTHKLADVKESDYDAIILSRRSWIMGFTDKKNSIDLIAAFYTTTNQWHLFVIHLQLKNVK